VGTDLPFRGELDGFPEVLPAVDDRTTAAFIVFAMAAFPRSG